MRFLWFIWKIRICNSSIWNWKKIRKFILRSLSLKNQIIYYIYIFWFFIFLIRLFLNLKWKIIWKSNDIRISLNDKKQIIRKNIYKCFEMKYLYHLWIFYAKRDQKISYRYSYHHEFHSRKLEFRNS